VKEIDEFIANADFLPPAFQLLPRLLLLLDDVEANADALADLIRVDPGLTADILRVCNSAAYGLQYPVDNIQQAILRIGFQEVHRVILTVITSPALKEAEIAVDGQKDLWSHSLAAAYSSQVLSAGAGLDADLSFTATLLHDIGKVVLGRALPRLAAEAQRVAAERNEPVYMIEREMIKTDHAMVGARLLNRWGFPKNLTAAVRHHHDPAAAKEEVRLASCVCLANILAYHVENVICRPKHVLFPDTRALKEFGLSQTEFEGFAGEAREKFELARNGFL
jgi:putative nucleotidyltransferase with HDIG domain